MSEQSRASVEDGEVEAASEPADSPHDEPRAVSRVPSRRSGSAEDDDSEDGGPAARPTGKRGRRRAAAEGRGDDGERRPAKEAKEGKKAKRAPGERSRNPFVAVVRFLREVVSELSKVIWPQRRQMVSYTVIVIIFVAVVVSFVAGLDIGFAKLTLWLLG